MHLLKNKEKHNGYTLIELLVVLSSFAILSTVMVNLYTNAQGKTRDAIRLENLKTIQASLQLYKIENGNYPVFTSPASSLDPSWSSLKSELGYSSFPIDPINEGSPFYSGFSYYYASDSTGREYDLIMNLENKTEQTCNNTQWESNYAEFTSGWLKGVTINWCSMSSALKAQFLKNKSGSAYLIMDH